MDDGVHGRGRRGPSAPCVAKRRGVRDGTAARADLHDDRGYLPEHVGHELAAKQQSGFGGIVSFEVKGDREEAWTVIDNTQFISITGNLGDVKSTITHPATTTHGKLSPEAKEAAGIREGLIRVSVGLEEIGDIIQDIRRGLDLI